MEKYCKRWDTTKPVSEFHKHASRKDGLNAYCRQCRSQEGKEWYKKNKGRHPEWRKNNPDKRKEWREQNPDKVKEYEERRIESTYGITAEHYNNLLDQQNNRCAICREESKDGKSLAIDHDHSCCKGKKSCGECVRQLLCGHCNMMLGHAKDNIELLEAAQNYLEKHTKTKNLEIISRGD